MVGEAVVGEAVVGRDVVGLFVGKQVRTSVIEVEIQQTFAFSPLEWVCLSVKWMANWLG